MINNIHLDSNNIFVILLTTLGLIFIILATMNFIAIVISYYILKHEIEEIEDENFRINLLHSLNTIWFVLYNKFIAYTEKDFFNDKVMYKNLIRYRLFPDLFNQDYNEANYCLDKQTIQV